MLRKRRRPRARRIAAGIAGLILLAALACLAATYRPAIAAVEPTGRPAFDPAQVARGAQLAALGDCTVCHTADGGAPFAGGRAIPTQFGTLYATNITPDPETGIGRWSQAAFTRAMREGVARNGAHLYPAFPYDHFTKVEDADISAIYAFLMTRRPVKAKPPANRLMFPLQFRPILAGWKLLFFHPGHAVPAADQTAEIARGAYLVEGLGHCGACHTPHNALGAETRSRALAGGQAEGWYAPPLNAASPAAQAWTADRLYTYLRTGLDLHHAAAAGPMGPVVRDLANASDADVRAIAAYIASSMQSVAPNAPLDRATQAAQAAPEGAVIFAGACSGCHEPGAPMMQEGRPSLALGTPLHEATPTDSIRIILQGLQPPVGPAGPYMPAFADTLTDAQMAQLLGYLRARFTGQAPWPDLQAQVQRNRRGSANG